MKQTIRGWELRKGIIDATHKIASNLRIRKVVIRWANIETACIDKHGVIHLADIRDDAVVPYKVFLKYLGFVVHELLHRKYTTFGLDYPNQYVFRLANALEDARIEHKAIASNLTGNIANLLGTLIDYMTTQALDAVTDWNDARQLPFVLAVFARQHATIKVPVHPLIEPIFTEACVRLNDCHDSHAVTTLAVWVYEQLKSTIDDQPEDGKDKPTEPSDSTDDGEPTDGEGNTPADGDGDGESTDGDGESAGKDGKPSGRISDINPDDAVDPEPKLDREKSVGMGISWSPDRTITKDCAHVEDAVRWDITPVGGAKLRYEVKRLFEMSGIDEYQFNRRHGQLDANNLHTVAAGNDRVFKRHHEEGGIDSAVVFVMDCSGSMFGCDASRMKSAAPVLATMLDTLDRAGVATSVVTFGTRVSMLKPFSMAKAKALPLIQRLWTGSDNSDSQALRYAHDLLLTRSEQRKVVFIIADGGVDIADQKRCMQQAKSGERLGITTIGIGIHADLSRMYPNNVRIDSLDELANASFKQIKLAA